MPRKTKKGEPKHILHYLKTHEPIIEEEAQKIAAQSEIARKAAKPRKTKLHGFGTQKGVRAFTA